MPKIKVYTKQITDKEYSYGLAKSIHFSLLSEGNGGMDAGECSYNLHNGYGVLFPEAEIAQDNTIAPRGADKPFVFQKDGAYFVGCEYVDEDMRVCHPDMVYMWRTADFIDFEKLGPVDRGSVEKSYADMSELEISDELFNKIRARWCEGSTGAINFAGRQSAHDKHYPLIRGFADPVFFKWDEQWYMLSTNDLNGNVGLFLRKAASLGELFTDGSEIGKILDYSARDHFIQTFWAPEWHIIGGVPYILFAVGAEQWAPQSHMMKYKGYGEITDPSSWELPVRVKNKDGSFLCENGITLDMTYFRAGGKSYVAWSERYNIGTSLDSGSMIYIATIDEQNPAILTSDRVLLSRPLFGWENVDGTINNEGPYPLCHNGKVYLAYSGGSAGGHTYAVGYLIANETDDLLDADNWSKYPTSVLNAYSVDGIDGPGHCSFFTDDNGDTMVAYHCQEDVRTSTYHKVYFDESGFPLLDRFTPGRI